MGIEIKVVIRRLTLPIREFTVGSQKDRDALLLEGANTASKDYLFVAVVAGGEDYGGFTVKQTNLYITGPMLQKLLARFVGEVKTAVESYRFVPFNDVIETNNRITLFKVKHDLYWCPSVNVKTTIVKIARMDGKCPGSRGDTCPCGQAILAIADKGKCPYGLLCNAWYLSLFGMEPVK